MDNLNQPPNNPYGAPANQFKQPPSGGGNGKIVAPGIALVVVGSLGLLASLYNIVIALTTQALPIDPNMPEFFQQMQANSVGIVPAIIQCVFVLINATIIFSGICMIRVTNWGLGLTGSILAMINCGSVCCLLGLPIGIWSLVILCQPDVKQKMK